MDATSRSLGFRLIAVSVAIVAAAALVVGVVVGKLSEDEVKAGLLRQARDVASAATAAVCTGGAAQDLVRVLQGAKAAETGAAWILDREGDFVATTDPRYLKTAEGKRRFGDTEIELIKVDQRLTERWTGGTGHRVALKSVIGRYESGVGVVQALGESHVVGFRVLQDRGWVVGVDEPYAASYSSTSSLKKYILLTCGVLGVSILLSTAISISFIIKPYYREKLELSERIEAANRNLKKLHEVSVSMQKSRSLEGRIQKILGAAHEVLGVDRIFIFLPNTELTVLECKGAFGNVDEPPDEIAAPLGPEGGVVAQAFLKRKPYKVVNAHELPKDLRLQPPYSEIKALRSRSFVVLPMIVESNCVGVVAVDNQLNKQPITGEIIERLELFTSQAAVAIENAKLYQQLKLYADELEITDHLTQLFTFFHFKKLLQGEIDRVRISGRAFSLAVLGIDNFARYNELLGHKFGDEVLRKVASIIREEVRKKDVIGRCFGSTFAVMFSNTGAAEAKSLCAVILSRLQSEAIPGAETLPEGRILFREGVAEYRKGEAWTAEDFFNEVHNISRKAEV